MGRHKTDPLEPVDLLDLLQELREGYGVFQRLSVGVDVLSQEHDFHDPVRHETLDLTDDGLRITAPLPPADIGNDAVTAEVIASEHNIHAGFERIFPFAWKILHDLVRIFPYIDDGAAGFHPGGQQFREFKDIVGPENEIHETIAFFQLLHHFRLLHHAAAQRDHHMGIFLFDPAKLSQAAVDALVCIFPDRTCIVDDEIRLLLIRFFHVADALQDAGQLLGIPGVHLASEGGYAKSKRPAGRLRHFLKICLCFLYIIVLALRLRHRGGCLLFSPMYRIFIHTNWFLPASYT